MADYMVHDSSYDYQEWFVKRPDCGEVYERTVQDPNFYMSFIWEMEKPILRHELEECRRRLNRPPRILDFACGTGRLLRFVETFHDDITGVDISPFMIDTARQYTKKSRLVVANLCEESWPETETFDFIACFRFLLRAQPELRQSSLVALKKLMRDDGLLLFSIQQNTWSLNMISVLLINWLRHRDNRYMSPAAVRRMLAPHGLEVLRVYGVGLLPAFLVNRSSVLKRFDQWLSGTQWLKWFSTDLIFICRKRGGV